MYAWRAERIPEPNLALISQKSQCKVPDLEVPSAPECRRFLRGAGRVDDLKEYELLLAAIKLPMLGPTVPK